MVHRAVMQSDVFRVSNAAPGISPTRTRASVLRTSIGCEWRIARSDLGWWAALIALIGCVGYSLEGGRARIAERARSLIEAQRDEDQRLASLTRLLGRIERNEVKPPDAPYRDPRNAIYVGRGQGATVAYLADAPLAIAAIGLSDLYPQVFRVSAGSKDSFLFVDEIANPAHLLGGSFDLAFVVVYVYPLLLLALCYHVLSGEEEQGTLALTVASSAPLARVLFGKVVVRAGGAAAAAIGTIWCYLALASPRVFSGGGLVSLVGLTLTIVLYGAFWTALALLVNSFRRDSAFNAVALVMAWVFLLLVGPAIVNAIAQVLYPAPARSEMVLAVRSAAIDAERDREATEARYRDEHVTASDRNTASTERTKDERTQHTLDVTLAADVRADAVLAEQEARVRGQRRLADRLALLVPPALIYDTLAELAGNGHTRWDDYVARVGGFHKTWQSFFVERAQRRSALTTADFARFPRFPASDTSAACPGTSGERVIFALAWVGAVTAALFVWSDRRLSRGL